MRIRLLVAAAMLSAGLAAHADTVTGVTIYSGARTASVDGNTASSDQPNGATTAYGTYDPSISTSTTTGIANSSQIAFTFQQTFEPSDYSTGGTAFTNFLASTDALYSITDPTPIFNDEGISTDSFDTQLVDLTTDTSVYDTNNGGSLTGTLVAGNEYQFTTQAGVTAQSDPSLTYDPSINFTPNTAVTPEPSSLALLGTGALSVLGIARRRLSARGAQPAS